ncbi:hypothetical protein K503DRAFT_868969 [Rhizopogon vinicolor AM-OR11-026]|uniref:Uncharacterized protein n=1 Tax=Rhizopogon vinicolor AM-OR11-026 TaxID=1314800 RepID=A0A1B7MP43_9AGAM|nr:hypothetical protein K503DRAFT_868969 [Rhizopogon vinicolor AM-OR11-026]
MLEISTNSPTPSAQTDRQGLKLAEHCFGPLLHPISATQGAWTNYSINRLQTNETHRSVLLESDENNKSDKNDKYCSEAWLSNSIRACVSHIESEMNLDLGTLRRCITILRDTTELEADIDDHRLLSSADNIVRLYSPTAPTYIDVRFRYLRRHRSLDNEWFYSPGYKIQRHAPPKAGSTSGIDKELVKAGPRGIYMRNGWQTLCWGHYDDSHGVQLRSWRCIEGEVEISEKGAVDAYETLFGDLVRPAADDSQGIFAYRRSLVRGMRLLLAAVGISYGVACTDDEKDKRPYAIMLEKSRQRVTA